MFRHKQRIRGYETPKRESPASSLGYHIMQFESSKILHFFLFLCSVLPSLCTELTPNCRPEQPSCRPKLPSCRPELVSGPQDFKTSLAPFPFYVINCRTWPDYPFPSLMSSIAVLDTAIQVYNSANCFTWTPHQVRRDIEGGTPLYVIARCGSQPQRQAVPLKFTRIANHNRPRVFKIL